MLSFKEYTALLENILDGSMFNKFGITGYQHTHEIDGNKVRIYYTKPDYKKNHYKVDFEVNDNFTGTLPKVAGGKSNTPHKVAAFVKASVHEFIKNQKPQRLYAKGIEGHKDHLYHKYFEHLSKKRGYSTSYHEVYGHALHTEELNLDQYLELFEGVMDDASFTKSPSGRYHHETHIDGHHIHVIYSPSDHEDDETKHYNVDFNVNGTMLHKYNIKGPTAHKISMFVRGSVNHFVKHVQPDSLHAMGTSRAKTKLYGKFFNHLGKMTKAKKVSTDDVSSLISFR